MAARHRNDLGPVGEQVRANLKQLREARGLSTGRLSQLLAEAGRPILPTAITKIESGDRRVDVGDLVALAVVLGVNPNRLLLPFTDMTAEVDVPGVGAVKAYVLWEWAEGQRPLVIPEGDDGTARVDFEMHARPRGIRQYRLATKAERNVYEREVGALPESLKDGTWPRTFEEARPPRSERRRADDGR